MIVFKILRKFISLLVLPFDVLITFILLRGNGVSYSSFHTSGIPYIMVARGGSFSIDENFTMNNGIKGNPIGCYEKCTFFVDRGAVLKIGKNVGISQAAVICHKGITIGDNVKIGGGVCIYDTDFHSLDPKIRRSEDDLKNRAEIPIIIHNNVFVGAKSIVLKGVEIGENSVVGAGSVVTKSIPANQIWAGNPAKFIRNI